MIERPRASRLAAVAASIGLLVVVLAESSQLEVVRRVDAHVDADVVVDELEELLLQVVDLLEGEHRAEDGEIDVVQRAVVPHLWVGAGVSM